MHRPCRSPPAPEPRTPSSSRRGASAPVRHSRPRSRPDRRKGRPETRGRPEVHRAQRYRSDQTGPRHSARDQARPRPHRTRAPRVESPARARTVPRRNAASADVARPGKLAAPESRQENLSRTNLSRTNPLETNPLAKNLSAENLSRLLLTPLLQPLLESAAEFLVELLLGSPAGSRAASRAAGRRACPPPPAAEIDLAALPETAADCRAPLRVDRSGRSGARVQPAGRPRPADADRRRGQSRPR